VQIFFLPFATINFAACTVEFSVDRNIAIFAPEYYGLYSAVICRGALEVTAFDICWIPLRYFLS